MENYHDILVNRIRTKFAHGWYGEINDNGEFRIEGYGSDGLKANARGKVADFCNDLGNIPVENAVIRLSTKTYTINKAKLGFEGGMCWIYDSEDPYSDKIFLHNKPEKRRRLERDLDEEARVIKISEAQIKEIVAESVRKVLNKLYR